MHRLSCNRKARKGGGNTNEGAMNVMETIKRNWQGWLFQGIPAAAVVLGAILAFGGQVQAIKDSIAALEEDRTHNAARLDSLSQQVQDMKLQIQRLEDQLQFQGKLIDTEPHKKGIDYFQQRDGEVGLPRDYNPNLR